MMQSVHAQINDAVSPCSNLVSSHPLTGSHAMKRVKARARESEVEGKGASGLKCKVREGPWHRQAFPSAHARAHTHTYTCTYVYTYIHARACIAELTRKLLVHYKMLWAGCSAGSRETVSLDIQLLIAHRLEVPPPLSPTYCHSLLAR